MSAGHMNPDGAGHPITVLDLDRADAVEASQTIEALLDGSLTAVVVRQTLSQTEVSAAVRSLTRPVSSLYGVHQ